MPATSPTLSPTLSAMTAGLRGSSSGMPASTLPTRSAPTSAALGTMPHPPRAGDRAAAEGQPQSGAHALLGGMGGAAVGTGGYGHADHPDAARTNHPENIGYRHITP